MSIHVHVCMLAGTFFCKLEKVNKFKHKLSPDSQVV